MQNLPYDINNKNSIIAYAKQLVNKSLRDICDKNIITDKKNKGGYGQLLEKFYFYTNQILIQNLTLKKLG